MEEHQTPEYSKEDLDKIFSEALGAAERLHNKLASSPEDAGYIKRALTSAKPRLDALFAKAEADASAYPVAASGIDFLKGLGAELDTLAGLADGLGVALGTVMNSTGTFSTISDSAATLWDFDNHAAAPIPLPPNRKSRADYSAKLGHLDKSIADSYDQVWQTDLGTSSDPHRAALFMMRTVLDNFFARLAPDDEVRKSSHWHRKEGDKPDQIWRSERLAYALQKHVRDPNRRTILEAEGRQIGALYEAANQAHNRGALNEEKSARALAALDSFLKDWLDSIGTPP